MREPATRRVLRDRRAWAMELGLALVTAGFVVLLFAAYELVGTNLSEEHSQARLAREFTAALARAQAAGAPGAAGPSTTATDLPTISSTAGAAPAGVASPHGRPASGALAGLVNPRLPVPPPGGALDHLVIPAIGLSRYVVQGVSEADLQMGPGHYPGTPLPGRVGNVGIAGHRTTFGAPFFRLNEVSPGDLIYLTDTSGTTWVYGVEHQWVVAPTDTAVLNATRQAVLTLTTCNPRFDATSRLVVRAVLMARRGRTTRATGGVGAVAARAQRTSETAGEPNRMAPPARGRPEVMSPGTASSGTVPEQTGREAPRRRAVPGAGAVSAAPASLKPAPVPGSAGNSTGGGAWLATICWGLLALVTWVATRVFAARLHRLTKALVLAAGVLVCLVPLWFAFENLVDLLPANI